MLVLVLVIEVVIAGRRLDFTTIWADDWRNTSRSAVRHAKEREVLIFGDSLLKFAVLPNRIEELTGIRSFNLALNAGTMPSAYFLLRRTLEAGVRPKAIVADFCTLMLPDRPTRSIRMYPELATPRDVFDLAWTSGDSDFFASTLLGQCLPSYKCRYEIQESVKAAFDGRRASPWPAQSAIWAKWKHQNGAQPMPLNGQGGPVDPGMALAVSPQNWKCDAINAGYVEKFLTLAESKQIPIFWLIPPLHPDVHVLRAAQGSDEAYTRFVRLTLDRHPEVVVLDARGSQYDRSLYFDTIHLGQPGALVLSTDLARILEDRLGRKGNADRWVSLPPCDRRRGEVASTQPAGRRR
jgi:hypothetical protein